MSCTTNTTVSSRRRSKQLDLLIEQGATFSIPIVYKEDTLPVDLTGATVHCQFREKINSPLALLNLSSGVNGGLVVTALEGKIVMTITGAQTDVMKIWTGVWDMVITFPSGEKFRILKGQWTLDRGVTR
jgi:hypothetical protein